ncbi:MAG: glycosyltransferase family 2 protein [Bacteroidales bacterium]|nr:glycosyltransferase family 2 protein [Bacteroidales bacterium]
MRDKNAISCIVITKNEEKNIGRCLRSLDDVADEIIVLDSFSEDATEEICKQHKVRFEKIEWKGYSDTKNYGNTLASYKYILSVDADEALSEALINEIIQLKDKGFESDGYMVNRLTNYCGKWIRHCGWYPDKKLRLWNKELGKWEGYIHEEVKMKDGSRISSLKSDLLHYSYNSINDHLQQMIMFTDMMAQDLINKGRKPGILKLLVSPFVKFIKAYFLQGGFRDGFYGFVISVLSSCATFLKYAKARQFILLKK